MYKGIWIHNLIYIISQSCLDAKHWPRVVNFTVKNGDALDLDMNQNFTIFGKIENQISANQPCTQTFHIMFDKHVYSWSGKWLLVSQI